MIFRENWQITFRFICNNNQTSGDKAFIVQRKLFATDAGLAAVIDELTFSEDQTFAGQLT